MAFSMHGAALRGRMRHGGNLVLDGVLRVTGMGPGKEREMSEEHRKLIGIPDDHQLVYTSRKASSGKAGTPISTTTMSLMRRVIWLPNTK
ncbi:hypothetical protein [Pseudomonas asiatica]|uniref:hypothetical protein n=1 Tax=Pseudomonas asiatica TaxID=2219225 RepID=UPI0010C0BB55|nr:hypothetical protein [Pseudomonas asiatica]